MNSATSQKASTLSSTELKHADDRVALDLSEGLIAPCARCMPVASLGRIPHGLSAVLTSGRFTSLSSFLRLSRQPSNETGLNDDHHSTSLKLMQSSSTIA
jgi:hypothetical protein